jgi:prolyl-tRNA editing enzyme YbaK/EbsC (Cys-tRNA(Pro) deacylase)
MHPSVIRVTEDLAARGAEQASRSVRTLDAAARTAVDAAAQLGVSVAQIANSLVFSADGAPLLVLASGGHRVDTARVAGLIGAQRVDRATPEFVREHTGFAIGGVAPVGHPAPIRTLVDVELERYDEVWAAAGHPHTVFPTTYAELVRITGGDPAVVGEPVADDPPVSPT